MARPSQTHARRKELLPRLAEVFGEVGYRRATTAALAERCELQETQLYRLWPSKKAMFLAVIEHLFALEVSGWDAALSGLKPAEAVEQILTEEGRLRGRSRLHRITLAAFSESDDPEIRAAMRVMYRRFHRYIHDALKRLHDDLPGDTHRPDPSAAAWALIGLGTMINIGREFDLFGPAAQRKLMIDIGKLLAEG